MTTDGTAAPERNERGAISAADFLKGHGGELARYEKRRTDLVWVAGSLQEVLSFHDYSMLTATIKSPAPETDAVLQQIGRNGPIVLEGYATNQPSSWAAGLRMDEIRRINDHVVPNKPTESDIERVQPEQYRLEPSRVRARRRSRHLRGRRAPGAHRGPAPDEAAENSSRHATGVQLVAACLRRLFDSGFDVRIQHPLAADDYSELEPEVAVVSGLPATPWRPPDIGRARRGGL